MDWNNKLDEFGRKLLRFLGEDPNWLPTDYNPVTAALKSRNLIAELENESWFDAKTCRAKMSRAATICQIIVYDANGGPDGDGKPKGLRRQWYAWYKTNFAQHLSRQLGDVEFKGWDGRLSQVYGEFVDKQGVTYRDLWVDDASRMMSSFWETLFGGCHIVLAVEKDSLFADFKAAAKALGAKTLVSGKGKQSKAATEKMLREHFSWTPTHNPFTADEPLIILHLSDHDMDGEAVIGPTFGEQARRYTEHILEARVGIKPEAIAQTEWPEKWYDVKVTNSGYTRWAESEGLFLAECPSCGHMWPVKGTRELEDDWGQGMGHRCPNCREFTELVVKVGKGILNQPHGFEVEALPTRAYYPMLVDALLQVLPFDYIISRLRDECKADAYQAARLIAATVYVENESYQALLKEFERLEAIKAEFENTVTNELQALGEPHTGDWRDDDDDPVPADFQHHVEQASDWSSPWRPFSQSDRTVSLVEWLEENEPRTIEQFEQYRIEW